MGTDDCVHGRFGWLFEMGANWWHHFQRAGGPIHSWGSTPGMETTMLLRAEGPTHPNGETAWREFGTFIGTLSHIRYARMYKLQTTRFAPRFFAHPVEAQGRQ